MLPETTVDPQCNRRASSLYSLFFVIISFDANCRVAVCPAHCAALQVPRCLMRHLMAITRRHTHTHIIAVGKQRRISCSLAHVDHKRVTFYEADLCLRRKRLIVIGHSCRGPFAITAVCRDVLYSHEPRFDGCHLSLRLTANAQFTIARQITPRAERGDCDRLPGVLFSEAQRSVESKGIINDPVKGFHLNRPSVREPPVGPQHRRTAVT